MKVYIGKHANWIGPYQIADMLLFWLDPTNEDHDELKFRFGNWLATDRNGNDSWLTKMCESIYKKRERNRKVKIHIDDHDVWGMDVTLTYIITPMLHKLKRDKHGSPAVDDDDVPDQLKSTSAPPKENPWDTDANWHLRWDWVLDEMIWAFENHHPDSDGESQFFDHSDVGPNEDVVASVAKVKVDKEGLRAYSDRKQNGFRLFGKYYTHLWS